MEDPLISTTEAAQLLKVSRRSVHRMVDDQRLTPEVIAPGGFNGSYMFRKADVDRVKAKRDAAAQAVSS